MTGMFGDIAEPEQILLAERGIIKPLGRRLPAILCPRHHIMHGARWTVTIQHLQRQLSRREFLLNVLECQTYLSVHHALGSLVAGKRPSDKMIPAGIPD